MSTLDLTKIKQIEQKHKYFVHGYIRNMQNIYSFHIIPALIINLCLLFWYDSTDEFDPKLTGIRIKISNKNKTIKHTNSMGWSTSYGKRIISSINNNTYIWKLKNIQNSTVRIYIGIDNSNAKCINDRFHIKKDEACYAYNAYCGQLFSWNSSEVQSRPMSFEGRDRILTMKLVFNNKDEGILSFRPGDDRKEFIIWKNITRDKLLQYRLAICMYTPQTGLN